MVVSKSLLPDTWSDLSSRSRLESLPTEILQSIFWFSHELSLIHTSHTLRSLLPAYQATAVSFTILAFCAAPDVPKVGEDEIFCRTSDAALVISRSLPDAAGLIAPLPLPVREQLQQDVLTSHWFSLPLFYVVHRFLFRECVLSLQSDIQRRQWTNPKYQRRLEKLINHCNNHSNSPADYFQRLSKSHLIVPGASMPETRLEFSYRMNKLYQYDDASLQRYERVRVCITQRQIHFDRQLYMPRAWNVLDIGAVPQAVLKGPFTPRKRGILTYLLNETSPHPSLSRYPGTRAELNQSILDAIPVGDGKFLALLLDLTDLTCDNEHSDIKAESAGIAVDFCRNAIFTGQERMLGVLFKHFPALDMSSDLESHLDHNSAAGLVGASKLERMARMIKDHRKDVEEYRRQLEAVDDDASSWDEYEDINDAGEWG